MMPEDALRCSAVRGEHGFCIGGSSLVCFDEGRQNLPVSSMIITIGICADITAINRFWPRIAHIMRFACVIPSLDLNEVGLQREDLPKAVFEVLLATAVPVVAAIHVLELKGRDAHHERFAVQFCAVEKGFVVGCWDDDVALGTEGPGIPVHRPV